MIQAVALFVLLFDPTTPSSNTGPIWLVIGASDASPASIAIKARTLSRDHKAGLVFETRDCGDKTRVFGWAAEVATSASAAQAALTRVHATIKGAYLKRCDARPLTLLALNVSAVDPSIADVPDSAVNWSDADRVSSVIPLPGGQALVVARYFVNELDDPREGRRERVVLVSAPDKKTTLTEDCSDAGAVTVRNQQVALQCAREQAADESLHSVLVFDAEGKRLAEIAPCRKPRWISDRVIGCSEESVGPDGQLKLRPKRTPLSPAAPVNEPRP